MCPVILILQLTPLLMQMCLMLRAQRAGTVKSAPEEGDWPFPELRLEKERLNHADLIMIFVHTWLTVEGCWRIYTALNRAR